jgi:TMEM175 potassium channel family protein
MGDQELVGTGRVEAFSDAVFAITITLLVLEIRRPAFDQPNLGQGLLDHWADYVAFAVSFVYIGVVWLNHHALFARIRKVDIGLNWINLGILATSVLLPFPAGVLAGAFSEGPASNRPAAAALYAIVAALMSAAWIPVFSYLARKPELLLRPGDAALFAGQRQRPLVGLVSYFLAAILGYFVAPEIAIALFLWMIAYHAITSEGLHANRLAQTFASATGTRAHVDRVSEAGPPSAAFPRCARRNWA